MITLTASALSIGLMFILIDAYLLYVGNKNKIPLIIGSLILIFSPLILIYEYNSVNIQYNTFSAISTATLLISFTTFFYVVLRLKFTEKYGNEVCLWISVLVFFTGLEGVIIGYTGSLVEYEAKLPHSLPFMYYPVLIALATAVIAVNTYLRHFRVNSGLLDRVSWIATFVAITYGSMQMYVDYTLMDVWIHDPVHVMLVATIVILTAQIVSRKISLRLTMYTSLVALLTILNLHFISRLGLSMLYATIPESSITTYSTFLPVVPLIYRYITKRGSGKVDILKVNPIYILLYASLALTFIVLVAPILLVELNVFSLDRLIEITTWNNYLPLLTIPLLLTLTSISLVNFKRSFSIVNFTLFILTTVIIGLMAVLISGLNITMVTTSLAIILSSIAMCICSSIVSLALRVRDSSIFTKISSIVVSALLLLAVIITPFIAQSPKPIEESKLNFNVEIESVKFQMLNGTFNAGESVKAIHPHVFLFSYPIFYSFIINPNKTYELFEETLKKEAKERGVEWENTTGKLMLESVYATILSIKLKLESLGLLENETLSIMNLTVPEELPLGISGIMNVKVGTKKLNLNVTLDIERLVEGRIPDRVDRAVVDEGLSEIIVYSGVYVDNETGLSNLFLKFCNESLKRKMLNLEQLYFITLLASRTYRGSYLYLKGPDIPLILYTFMQVLPVLDRILSWNGQTEILSLGVKYVPYIKLLWIMHILLLITVSLDTIRLKWRLRR